LNLFHSHIRIEHQTKTVVVSRGSGNVTVTVRGRRSVGASRRGTDAVARKCPLSSKRVKFVGALATAPRLCTVTEIVLLFSFTSATDIPRSGRSQYEVPFDTNLKFRIVVALEGNLNSNVAVRSSSVVIVVVAPSGTSSPF